MSEHLVKNMVGKYRFQRHRLQRGVEQNKNKKTKKTTKHARREKRTVASNKYNKLHLNKQAKGKQILLDYS